MKNKLLGVVFSILAVLMAFATFETQNPIQGLLTLGTLASAISHFTTVEFDANILFCVPLVKVNKTPCQKANAGGNRKFLVISCDDFTEEWPRESDIDVITGVCSVTPPLRAGKMFAYIDFTDNTAKVDYGKEGDEGNQSYKHVGECKLSGYNGSQFAALRMFLNMNFVLIAMQKDTTMVVYGTSEKGLSMKETHTTGTKRSDKNEFTLKMEQDGFSFAPVMLAGKVVIAVLGGIVFGGEGAFNDDFSGGFS